MHANSNKVEYRALVEDILSFQLDTSAVPKSSNTVRSGLTDAVAWNEPKSIWDDDYVVLDSKKVPQHTIE